jgi:hypothetical protein
VKLNLLYRANNLASWERLSHCSNATHLSSTSILAINLFLSLRLLCVILSLSASVATATAQTLPPATTAATPAFSSTLTRADTARAIHELFRSRRGGGTGWLALGTAGILASTLPAQQSTSAGVWTPGVVAGSAFLLIGLNKRIQFRPGRERQVLRELAATGHLPPNVARRLRGNYASVHGSASEDNPLLAKGIIPSNAAPAPLSGAAPSAPAVAAAPAQLLADARTDTLDAVRGLFMKRRTAGAWPLVILLPVARILTGSGATSSNTSPYAPKTSPPSDNSVGLGLGLMGAGLVYMLVHNAPYTNNRYLELSQAYNNGQPLPTRFREKLRPRHLELGRKYRQRMERKAQRRRG